jgi:Protein of unknown function (DUF3352)
MTDQQPPSGTPEYLEQRAGSPIPPEQTPGSAGASGRRSGRHGTWWVGGGVVALLGLGAGAWAALAFFQQGAQPAVALPSTTLGYVSIDLDPAGGQKVDAFRTLNKFPAFKDQVGVDSVDELRHKLGDALVEDSGCADLTYSRDIDPWLGDRMAAAVVPLGSGEEPHLVAVLQVKDDDQARAGIAKIDDCSTSSDDGVVVKDGWAVLAESQQIAVQVCDATQDGSLADDATYQRWTGAVGEAGVVNAYASPDAGRVLAQELGGFLGGGAFASELGSAQPYTATQSSAYHVTAATPDQANPFSEALSGFKGAAATLRFTGDGLELAVAADRSGSQLSSLTGNTGGTLVQRLPDDTAAAAGVTLPNGWLDQRLQQMSALTGTSPDAAMRELSRETGLDLPADAETLLGSGLSLSVGQGLDLEAVENSADGSGLPIAATIKGDAAGIERVLDKIRAKVGDVVFLGSDTSGDLVVVGPSADYRHQVLAGGHLGDGDAFTSVIPDAGDASSLFYVDVDALEPSIAKAAAGDQETLDNVTPLRAVGASSWTDGEMVRFSVQISTN